MFARFGKVRYWGLLLVSTFHIAVFVAIYVTLLELSWVS